MTREETQELNHGLYRVYWKLGGFSLAAVGSYRDGNRWIAPINWVSVGASGLQQDSNGYLKYNTDMSKTWNKVDKVESIKEST